MCKLQVPGHSHSLHSAQKEPDIAQWICLHHRAMGEGLVWLKPYLCRPCKPSQASFASALQEFSQGFLSLDAHNPLSCHWKLLPTCVSVMLQSCSPISSQQFGSSSAYSAKVSERLPNNWHDFAGKKKKSRCQTAKLRPGRETSSKRRLI